MDETECLTALATSQTKSKLPSATGHKKGRMACMDNKILGQQRKS